MTRTCIISAPIDTYSGYGGRSRDIVKSLIQEYPDWDIKILSQRWGDTSFGFLKDHNLDELSSRIVSNVTEKPDVWIQITIPNEFRAVGSFNIGITAGIETTVCDSGWLQGINRMNLVITSSEHSKNVFEKTQYSTPTGGLLKAEVPIKVLFEGVDTQVYKKVDGEQILSLNQVQNPFCFLVVGHWMKGKYGHDRKNIGYTIKTFLESFKNISNPPALIAKIQRASPSLSDQKRMLDQIGSIREQVGGRTPDVYLVHGDITDEQMNGLYNNPKVKCMVSLTKGEGFGRPLLEFSTTGKPIICSNWSGPQDFLSPEHNTLVPGIIHNVDSSAVVENMILAQAQWFHPDEKVVKNAFKDIFKRYKKYVNTGGLNQQKITLRKFTLSEMSRELKNIVDEYLIHIPQKVTLNLPVLD